ncbi:hypothetical protein [Haloarcula nitratireducens]|uniref:DUF8080 domain-containing protein n=1 Tax=Haloarcula nitratireducens TaxID=2487749 RepID=A0AAW4PDZ8_9EURY|nr:hypothetical protein [Halomicroarcula nitratireducens]MBX0295870.1 hypothetical protein [Halomicroarcula nitratireducens]
MVSFDCTTIRHDGVTLVTARLRGIDEPTRVRVRNRLDGPVWPPRRRGTPEAGWTDSGFEAVVGPGSHALGYATPASPADPAAELCDVTPAPDAVPVGDRTETAADVVRELGDPSPPADAVPIDAATDEPSETRSRAPARSPESSVRLPDEIDSWLVAMAHRVERAEALAAAETLQEATTAVGDAGGLAGVRTLADAAERDERRLRAVARRAEALADRRAAASVPVETLARLA